MKRLICMCLVLVFSLTLTIQTVWAAAPSDGHIYEYVEDKSKAATCTEEGYLYYECINHADIFYTEPIKPLGHAIYTLKEIPADCTHPALSVKACQRCDYTETTQLAAALGHNYTSAVTSKATCIHEGIRTFTCTACGDSYTQTIAKLAHSYQTVTVPATAEKDGKVEKVCRLCGDTKLMRVLPRTGHVQVKEAVVPKEDKRATILLEEDLSTKEILVLLPSIPNETNDTEDDTGRNFTKKVNEMIITNIILEIGVFAFFIYRDVSVLRWYSARKKEVLMKRITAGGR